MIQPEDGLDIRGDTEAEEAFKSGGAAELVAHANKKLNEWKEVEVHIAVVGQSGAGKSSFINAIRGINDKDNAFYAMTGVTECTKLRKSYDFPDNAKLKMWDLPGAGTENFKASVYAEEMKFSAYDGFVLLSSERFTEIDNMIADEISKINKPFFFARTKMDNAMRDQKREDKDKFNSEETKEQIRKECQKHIGEKQKIFLISNLPDIDLSTEFPDIQFDNNLLKIALAEKLPEIQKTALVFSLTCNTREMIAMKKKEISKRFKWLAILSAAGGAVFVPGVSMAIDMPIMIAESYFQKKQLGIDDAALNSKGRSIGIDRASFLQHLSTNLDELSTPLNALEKQIFLVMMKHPNYQKMAISTIITSVVGALETVEIGAGIFVPGVGSIIAAAISGGSTYGLLKMMLRVHALTAEGCIDVIEEIAKKIMK
eukprot:TRINITY_DN28041_c0_g1_i1.p1 TRINITY_DN28041_c0_g1~~TRINITY_DN28041_c0_g1_i1.p1  ORF type:complete len:428 (-),score=101.39 TRINITY_DN28041_c0_g1_i1:24-1307(-)